MTQPLALYNHEAFNQTDHRTGRGFLAMALRAQDAGPLVGVSGSGIALVCGASSKDTALQKYFSRHSKRGALFARREPRAARPCSPRVGKAVDPSVDVCLH